MPPYLITIFQGWQINQTKSLTAVKALRSNLSGDLLQGRRIVLKIYILKTDSKVCIFLDCLPSY